MFNRVETSTIIYNQNNSFLGLIDVLHDEGKKTLKNHHVYIYKESWFKNINQKGVKPHLCLDTGLPFIMMICCENDGVISKEI